MLTVLTYASAIIAGIIVVLNVIAPLTKTSWDNKALDVLRWIEDVGLKLVLPQHTVTSGDPTPVVPAAK